MEAKPVVKPAVAEVIPVSAENRVNLMLVVARRRAADADVRATQLMVERVIERLDKDGQLRAAIQESQAAMARQQEAGIKMAAVLADVQKEVGHSLEGYRVDQDSGNLIKMPVPPAAVNPAPAPAKVVPLKPAKKGKTKK
jgi:hypothetical protein